MPSLSEDWLETSPPAFTQEHAELLLRAARTLLSVCDGAQARDGQGFNAPDSQTVRGLLSHYDLTEPELAELHLRLRRYRTQLQGHGIDIASIPAPSMDRTDEGSVRVLLHAEVHESWKQVVVPFGKHRDRSLYDVATSAPGRSYLNWIIDQTPSFREPWRTYAIQVLEGTAAPAPTEAKEEVKGVTLSKAAPGWLAVGFPRERKDEFKDAIDGRRWNGPETRWEVPESQVRKVVQFFGGREHVELDAYAEARLAEEQNRRETLDAIRVKADTAIEIPGLKLPLWGYQNVGVEFALQAGGRAMIADEMGLGKTLQFIAFALHRRASDPAYRALVVCPAAVRINWVREIRKFTGEEACVWTTQGPDGDLKARWHIVNYDALIPRTPRAKKDGTLGAEAYPVLKELNELGFSGLGVDECHYLKTRDSARTQAVMGAALPRNRAQFPGLNIKDVVFLTGTPVLNRPAEIFTLLNFLSPGRFPNWFSFANRYGCWDKGNLHGRPSTPQNLDELHERTKDLVLRRLCSEVQKDMPPLLVNDVYVTLTTEERRAYDKLFKALLGDWKEHGKPGLQDMNIFGEFLNARKLSRAWELIDEFVEAGHSVLLFSTRLAPLQETAQRYGATAVTIDGSMSLDKRQVSIDRIQDGSAKVGCLSIRAAGVGINLTAADRVIFLDMDWVPANHLQAQKRAHRAGQQRTVLVTYLLVEDTVDEIMREVLEKKLAVADQIVDGITTTKRRAAGMFTLFVRKLRAQYKQLSNVSDPEDETPLENAA